ncbi:oxidoreductase, short chain dehydrogenase/reductase family protein [Onchocerca flexuosa]|uniref:Oxidoreductase, short chain dehydrogenase/reductase family protein n=2 Tax=Onchocerca flexuosa TaxID=387005 RepID=A0A238C3B2_9BILA|nr:oxidoreductase, short chain dehydrogenase/reductase family protein [Onchocerca flexuosa]
MPDRSGGQVLLSGGLCVISCGEIGMFGIKMICHCALVLLGWAFLLYLLYHLITSLYHLIYPFFIATPINLHKAAGGKWAVVTGSTDGIGKAYAFELAKRGFSIVLISRTQNKLDIVKEELEKEYGIEIRTIAFDFTSGSVNDYEKTVLLLLRELDIGILVNNVGVSFSYPEVIHKAEGGLQRLADIDIVNTLPVTLLCAAVLPQMVERNSGIIVNISSATSYTPLDLLSVYSASKKYVTWLSKALQTEYAQTNIIIQNLCPMFVATKMSKISRPSFFFVTAEDFVKSAVQTIGIVGETAGCFPHQLQIEIMKNLPEWVVVPYLSKKSKLVRKKALAKKARDIKAACS